MSKYYRITIKKEIFNRMLNLIENQCSYFELVEPNIPYMREAYKLPTIKKLLQEYCIEEKAVTEWNGTAVDLEQNENAPIQHRYKCCPQSINYLRKYKNIFDIEDQMDISFYTTDGTVILFTISHENICVCDMDFWGEFINKYNLKVYQY